MKLLAAIIAGGAARRFGADKGAALLGGRALIDHVADALRPQSDALVIVGRDWPGLPRINDRPGPGEGPLGGIAGALHHAKAEGFDAVLCAGCDTLPVPDDLHGQLTPGPAVVEGHWLLGLWPVALSESLDHWLTSQPDRSIRGFLREAGARYVPLNHDFLNINTPEALAEAERILAP